MIKTICDGCKVEMEYTLVSSITSKSLTIPEYVDKRYTGEGKRMYMGARKYDFCTGCYAYLMLSLRTALDTLIENPEENKIKYEF